jgi:hypothetical protein
MDVAVSLQLAIPVLKSINRCRMYLKCIFISDIMSADGATILPEALMGTSSGHSSTLEWIIQLQPCRKDWYNWTVFHQYISKWKIEQETWCLDPPNTPGLALVPR